MIINRNKLKTMMEERGINTCDLAKRSGLSEAGVRLILKKEKHNVTTSSLEKLAKGFRLTYEELTELLELRMVVAEELDLKEKKIQQLERELKKARRALEPRDKKIGVFLKKTDLEELRLLAHKNDLPVNSFIQTILEEVVTATIETI